MNVDHEAEPRGSEHLVPLRRFGFVAFVSDWTDLLETTSAEIHLFGCFGQQLNLIQENLKLTG